MTDAIKPIQPLSFSESRKNQKNHQFQHQAMVVFIILFYSASEITKNMKIFPQARRKISVKH
jgi:hypothetical protein